ncbi:MAG: hypothetical protein HYX76_01325 [Acidobacteria bacterium]|nr:hypothetical protein [Acidobacteriota bacterium]
MWPRSIMAMRSLTVLLNRVSRGLPIYVAATALLVTSASVWWWAADRSMR